MIGTGFGSTKFRRKSQSLISYYDCQLRSKNIRRPKEAHIAQNLNEIEILDRAGELKELDQH